MRLFLLASLVALGSISLPAPRAEACINSTRIAKDKFAKLVATAEAALQQGNYGEVFSTLDLNRRWRQLGILEVETDDGGLMRRAALVMATATIRTGDGLDRGIERIDELLVNDKKSPTLLARRAEGLYARNGKGDRDAAKVILVELESKDLMPDAEAWAVLARLRDPGKEAAERTRALERCSKLATRKGICPGNS